jgi:UrcA family protein
MNKVQGHFASLAMAAALAATAATLLATGAPAAAAGPAAQSAPTRAVGIRYTDLNLASPDGLGRLEDRVRHAAERLCRDGGAQAPAASFAVRKCVKQAVAAAAPQVRQAIASQRGERFAARAALAD